MTLPPPPKAPESPTSKATLTVLGACAVVAVAFCVVATLTSAFREDWTFDEPDHLAYSRRLLETGETERASHIHFNSKTPITVANVIARQTAKRWFGIEDQDALRLITRLPTSGWLCLLLASVWLTARWLWGASAAHLAVVLCAVEPNLIAHGSLATVDVAYALATLWVIGAAYAFGRRPTPLRCSWLGGALGYAFAVKFTAFILLPLMVLPLAWSLFRTPPAERPRRAGRMALGLTAAALLAALVVCAAYGFAKVGQPLAANRWRSAPMMALERTVPDLRLPLPLDLLTGIDISYTNERMKAWPVLILGRTHEGGVWYYFLFHWLVKTPVALLVAEMMGLWLLFRRGMRTMAGYLLAILILTMAYLSLGYRAQVGYRHALMLVPIACLLAAAGLARTRRSAMLGLAVLVLAIAEQWPYLGDHLAFTNLAVWPKQNAWRVTGDSNIDYGQDSMKAEAWVQHQPSARLDPAHILPGRNVFGITALYHVQHRWIREHLRPDGHFRFSHVYFDVDEPTFLAYLDAERRLKPNEADRAACDAESERRTIEGGGFSLALPTTGDDVFVLCLDAHQRVIFVLRGRDGYTAFGHPEQRRKTWSWIGPGQVAWYRLEPGRHALVLSPLKGDFRGTVETDAPTPVFLRDARLVRGYLVPPPATGSN